MDVMKVDAFEILNRHEVINQTRYISLLEWRKIEEDRGWKSEYMIYLSPSLYSNNEVMEWVESNTTSKWNIIWNFWLEFENESDVIAFKIRWM